MRISIAIEVRGDSSSPSGPYNYLLALLFAKFSSYKSASCSAAPSNPSSRYRDRAGSLSLAICIGEDSSPINSYRSIKKSGS